MGWVENQSLPSATDEGSLLLPSNLIQAPALLPPLWNPGGPSSIKNRCRNPEKCLREHPGQCFSLGCISGSGREVFKPISAWVPPEVFTTVSGGDPASGIFSLPR